MDKIKVLIIEDEEIYRKILRNTLKEHGMDVHAAESGEEAWELIKQHRFPVIISDIRLSGKISGMDILKDAKELYDPSILMITAFGEIEMAVEAMRLGAFHFITKPFEVEDILKNIDRMILQQKIISDQLQPSSLEELSRNSGIVGNSRKMCNLMNIALKAARSDATVLITGESGTGKELIAKAIYLNSSRKDKEFVAINCATLSDEFLESALFGHVKGSYTGAIKDKVGLFEKADGGTLFMDEVGDISKSIQAKILRVLQEGEYIPLGSTETKKANVRIIAATNKNLLESVDNGEFREDLYYRLNVINIMMPPLRDRKSDIPLLINHFIKKFNAKLQKKVTRISPEIEDILMDYDWPGNIRELENVIERAMVLCSGNKISKKHLPGSIVPRKGDIPPITLTPGTSWKDAEKELIIKTLQLTKGNKQEAAKMLGISLRKIEYRVKEWGITSSQKTNSNCN
ncbi:MAG: sigma-54-dependent Fis family transcriptional regulator [Candidatus Kuenenia sp.]|nr:sigma-54-dependent Fis family transcriptional regulator [Candidatus Kuenenia hertensis]